MENKYPDYPVDRIPTAFNRYYFRPSQMDDLILIEEFADTKSEAALAHASRDPQVLLHASPEYKQVQFIIGFEPDVYGIIGLTQEAEKFIIRALKDPAVPLLAHMLVDRYSGKIYTVRTIPVSRELMNYALHKIKEIPTPPLSESLALALQMNKDWTVAQMVSDATAQMRCAGLL